MGLRLTSEGISAQRFRQTFGRELDEVYGPQLSQLEASGLLEWADPQSGLDPAGKSATDREMIRLTSRGKLLGNRVFAEFLDAGTGL